MTLSAHELHRRLGIAHRALNHHHTHAQHPARHRSAERLAAATSDIEYVTATTRISRALAHLNDHQGGYPTGSNGPQGIGGHSDRTGTTATNDPDQVASDLDELDTITARIERTAMQLLCSPETQRLTRQLETDTARARWLIARWAKEPDMRWCAHCWQTNRHREPAATGRYRDLCRPCGDWRKVNKSLPPADVLAYLQTRRPVPQALMRRHRAKLPRPGHRPPKDVT